MNAAIFLCLQVLALVWAVVYVVSHIRKQSTSEMVAVTIVTQDGESIQFNTNFTKQMSQKDRKAQIDSYFNLGELRRGDILERMARIREESEAEVIAQQAARKARGA